MSIRNKKQAHQAVKRQFLFIADAYHDYIIDEIYHRDHIKYERQKNK